MTITDATFFRWASSYGTGTPFEHDGTQWKCFAIEYPASGGHSKLEAGEVVPQEEFAGAVTDTGGYWPSGFKVSGHVLEGGRGRLMREGNARTGRPWVYTGVKLAASTRRRRRL